AGFIGSNLIRWILGHQPGVDLINLDLLTYAGNLESLEDLAGRYYFIRADVRDFDTLSHVLHGAGTETATGKTTGRPLPAPDCVVHMAAEPPTYRPTTCPGPRGASNARGSRK